MDSKFIVMWCNEGIECVVDITNQVGMELFDAIAQREGNHKLQHMVSRMMLRARFNSQRHYEIYSITAAESITEDDIREMFEQSPQYSADLIREKGVKLFSDRAQPVKVKIV